MEPLPEMTQPVPYVPITHHITVDISELAWNTAANPNRDNDVWGIGDVVSVDYAVTNEGDPFVLTDGRILLHIRVSNVNSILTLGQYNEIENIVRAQLAL
jgi:hypothetical protein